MSSNDDSTENVELPARRRRSFLATRRSDDLEADTIPFVMEEDDIPVLTEVVPTDEDEINAPSPEEATPDPVANFDTRLEELATQMSQAIGQQMAWELPTLIEATLLNASEELRAGITATMEAALRDFIAHRKQLQLPLDDPEAKQRTPY